MRFQQTLFNIIFLSILFLGAGCSQSESLTTLSIPPLPTPTPAPSPTPTPSLPPAPTPSPTPTPNPPSSLTATISGEPISTNSTTILNITVAGTSIVEYIYKVGISITTDCGSPVGYSAAIPVVAKITDNISILIDGPIKICVLGKDVGGGTQDFSSPTMATWSKDTTGPSAPGNLFLGAVPTSNNLTPTISWTLNSTDTFSSVASYQAQVYNASDNSIFQSWTTITNNSALNLPLQNPLMMEQSYYLNVRAIDDLGNIGPSSVSTSNWTAATLSVSAIGGLVMPPNTHEVHCSASPGKFYAFGGIDNSYSTWQSINHLSTNGSFAAVPSTPSTLLGVNEPMGVSMVWVPDKSQYFIFGGYNPSWTILDDVNLYNPFEDIWATGVKFTTDIPLDASQTYIPNNTSAFASGSKVYIWNTVDDLLNPVGDLYVYDFDGAPKKWKKLSIAPANLAGPDGFSAFGDGKLVVMRPYKDGSLQWQMTAGVYDIANDVWSIMDLNQPNAPPKSSKFDLVIDEAHHKLFMFGGFFPECNLAEIGNPACDPYAQTYSSYNQFNYSYDLLTGIWSKISTVNQPSLRSELSAVWTKNVIIVTAGQNEFDETTGIPGWHILNDIYAYYPEKDQWVKLTTPSEASYAKRGGVKKQDGCIQFDTQSKVFLWGGFGDLGASLNSGSYFDLPL